MRSSVPLEVQLCLDDRRGFVVPGDEKYVDLFIQAEQRHPTSIPVMVDRVSDVDHRVVMEVDRLDQASDLSDLVIAIWSPQGRRLFTHDELMERAEDYRRNEARETFYTFDMRGDLIQFTNPFRSHGRTYLAVPDESDLQLSMDGRAVRNPHAGALGNRQAEVLRVMQYRPLTSTEAGVLIHALHGCPEYQREDRYMAPYVGHACCRKAVDEASHVMGTLRDQGRIWKHDDLWMTYPERKVWIA